jgi:hypothetical protein
MKNYTVVRATATTGTEGQAGWIVQLDGGSETGSAASVPYGTKTEAEFEANRLTNVEIKRVKGL